MTTLQGAFMVLDLGTPNVKYFWKGQELQGVVKMFVYKGTSVTLTVQDKTLIPYAEMKEYGLKIKEVK